MQCHLLGSISDYISRSDAHTGMVWWLANAVLGKSQTNDEYKKKVLRETNVDFTSIQIGSDVEDDDDSPVAIGAGLPDPESCTQPTQPQRQVQKQNVESEPVVACIIIQS